MHGLASSRLPSLLVEPRPGFVVVSILCGFKFFVAISSLFWFLLGAHSLIKGKKCACATVCHSQAETAFVSSVLATKVFSMARSGDFQIAAFPDFQGALAQIKEFQKSPQPSYQVCVATGDGSLVVRQSLVEFWTKKHPSFSDQTLRLLEKHNAEFNLKGLKRGAESEEGQTQETMEKEEPQLALGTAKTIADLESSYPDVERLGKGSFADLFPLLQTYCTVVSLHCLVLMKLFKHCLVLLIRSSIVLTTWPGLSSSVDTSC